MRAAADRPAHLPREPDGRAAILAGLRPAYAMPMKTRHTLTRDEVPSPVSKSAPVFITLEDPRSREVPLDFPREWIEFTDPANADHVVRAAARTRFSSSSSVKNAP